MKSFDELWESYLEEAFEPKIIKRLERGAPTPYYDIIKLAKRKDYLVVTPIKSGYKITNKTSKNDKVYSFHKPHGSKNPIVQDGGIMKNVLNIIRGERLGR